MFCPNCGNKLNGDEQFCNNCGTRLLNDVEQINDNSNSTNETMSEMISRKSDSFLKPIISNCKSFINRYKKQLLILASCFIIFIIGVLLFGKFYGFEKLSWDEKYEILKVDHILNSKIKLGIIFNNKEELKKLKYSSSCGEVKNKDLTIDWDLTEAEGDCEISVSYKLRKIKKKFKVVTEENDLKKLALEYKIDYDSEEDLDLDGLTNKQEKEYKTNAVLSDTDMDGLDDKYEILTSKTDPLKKDSDNDGLNDYDEIELGLNPLKADSKDDGVKDGSRTLTYNYTTDNLNVSITGTGNIASTLAEVTSNTKISNKEGMIDNLYTFYTEGKMTEATVTIGYTDEELIELGLNEDNLSIYYYNEKDSKYEKIETTIDKVNNTLTAVLKHFSNYVVGDSSLVKETITNQVLFVLDNSWSMYTNEQYKEITGKEYYGGIFGSSELDGFDAEGVRFTLTSDLITKLSSKNYKIGLSEFRRDYANALEIGSDSKSLKSKLNAMNGSFITNSEGTNITNALNNSIDEFVDDSDNKYIVILTDGQDSSLKSNTQSIIKKAIENNVKICSIGFGGGSYNAELSNISNSTGCKFYSSGNSQGLTELFDNVGAELNDNLIDTDHRFPETVWDLTKLRVVTFELPSEQYAAERMVLPRLVLNYAKHEHTMFWNPPTLLDPSIRTSWMFWARSTVNRITPKDRSLTWLLNSQGPGETADWNALSGQGVFRANILPADYHSVNLMRIMRNGMEFKAIPGRHAISIGRAIDLPNPGGALHYYQLEMEGPEGDRIQTLPIFVSAGNRPGMVRHPFLLEDNKSIVDIEIEKARIPYWYFPCNAEAGEFLTDVSGYAHHGRLQHGDRVWGPFGSLGYTGYFHYHNGDVLFKPEKCFMRDGDQRGFYRFDRDKKDCIVISGGTAFPYASTYEIELRPQKTGQEMGIFGAPNGQISLTIDPEGYLNMLRTGEVEGIAGSKPGPGYKVKLKSVKPLKWDKWQHIAVTYDLRMLRLYVDGELQAESPCRPNPAFETIDHVTVGALCRFLIQPHTFYSGDLRNIRISGRCLAPGEFLQK